MTITEIFSETRDLCSASTMDYPDTMLLRRTNNNNEEVVGDIIGVDGNWEFDDTNYTTHPIATADLVNGQQDYSFDVTFLDILSLSIKDSGGIWREVRPLDKSQFGIDPQEFFKESGMPLYYDKIDTGVFLYPAPATGSVTMTAGLKAYFQRTADPFTTGDLSTGTKAPGFMSPYHKIIAYMNAIPYCMAYKPERVNGYMLKVQEIKQAIKERYSKRAKDEPRLLRPKYRSAV